MCSSVQVLLHSLLKLSFDIVLGRMNNVKIIIKTELLKESEVHIFLFFDNGSHQICLMHCALYQKV